MKALLAAVLLLAAAGCGRTASSIPPGVIQATPAAQADEAEVFTARNPLR